MNVLACIKRVPAPGAKIVLTDDEQEIDTRHLGFTMSPHEECAVEEALRIVEQHGGTSTVLTLGPVEADEQLRLALSLGIDKAVLLLTREEEWDPIPIANAISHAIRQLEDETVPLDLILFGNESADSGGYQVGIRVAHDLGLPVVTGVKAIEIGEDTLTASRQTDEGFELYEVALPAVVTVKEGINLPRYPGLTGRLRARKQEILEIEPRREGGGLEKVRLRRPPEQLSDTEVLGHGAEAAPKVVDLLQQLGLV